ncbi:YbaB/EbfC family nucleoid-associated protein [Actinosynnema sp. CS-041913]|uniref:YbaB/EbfC family nucleoid-associated protein n=1 Tax=Actinosynnema sp. CS-041913 TaxID=3239917 RepID=UPI003D8DB67E
MSVQEERIAAADRLTDVLARVTGTASHESGLVTVTASAVGALKAVRLEPAALGQGPDAVGRMVAETARLATDAAVQTSYNELAKTLGDSMAMAIEDFAGPPPLHRQEPAAPQPPQGPPAFGARRTPGAAPAYGQPQAPGAVPEYGQRQGHGAVRTPGARPAPGAGQPQEYGQPQVPGASAPNRPETTRPWSAQPPKPAQRPRPPVEDDEDDFFADPFRGQRQ